MKSACVLDATHRYRYSLTREWAPPFWRTESIRSLLFVMLNPSTADASRDDPTIRRCIEFAKAWDYDGFEVVNLFALRASDPIVLTGTKRVGSDPVGPGNLAYVQAALDRAGLVVAALTTYHGEADEWGYAVVSTVTMHAYPFIPPKYEHKKVPG